MKNSVYCACDGNNKSHFVLYIIYGVIYIYTYVCM